MKVVLYPCVTTGAAAMDTAEATLNKNQAWAGVGQGLISLSADNSLCLSGSKSGKDNLQLGLCSAASQYKYDTQTQKISPLANAKVCIDIDPNSQPPAAELYGCNDKFEKGANEQFDFDATTGALTSHIFGAGLCISVCL
jgi:hypothetical protein